MKDTGRKDIQYPFILQAEIFRESGNSAFLFLYRETDQIQAAERPER